jgi:hypothetical protein
MEMYQAGEGSLGHVAEKTGQGNRDLNRLHAIREEVVPAQDCHRVLEERNWLNCSAIWLRSNALVCKSYLIIDAEETPIC